MANYKALFSGVNPNGGQSINYELDLVKDTGVTGFTEILLAGSSPVTLAYSKSQTPFDPVRTGSLTISVVADTYLEDILPSNSKEVQVILKNLSNNTTVWVGWLRPFVLDAGYRDEYENFELYADDCLGILKYYPFQTKTSGTTTIVTFNDILAQICDTGELVKGYFWGRTKKRGNSIVLPTNLGISEKNFYYDDVDETLKLDEVLEHLCQYIGYTAIQEGEYIYLFDFQAMKGNATQESMARYLKSQDYEKSTNNYNIGSIVTLSQDYVVGSSPSISIEPIKNRIEVRDNYYNIDYFIPSIFDDELLTNRFNSDNFNYAVHIPDAFHAGTRDTERGKWRNGIWTAWEDVGDTAYTYYHRVYDNKYWESVYNNSTTSTTTDYKTAVGGTIVEHGCVKNDYKDEYQQNIVQSSIDYKRYLMISQQNTGAPVSGTSLWEMILYPQNKPTDYPVFRLKSGYTADFVAYEDSYLVINGSIMFEKYIECPYINPDWKTDAPRYSVLPITPGGVQSFGYIGMKLGIGDKWWNGTGWTTTNVGFWIPPQKTQKTHPAYNINSNILNNVKWDLYIGADGYKIPLSGVDTTQEVKLSVLLPSIQFMNGSTKEYNGFAWISDLSFKVYRAGESESDNGKENDFVESNVISSGSIMDMNSIDLKITTAGDGSKPSWSDCIYISGNEKTLLTSIKEDAISNSAQRPEQNIIQKYVEQYSQQTKKITIVLPSDISQFVKFENLDVDNPNDKYVILGTEIDYKDGSQRITAIKKN